MVLSPAGKMKKKQTFMSLICFPFIQKKTPKQQHHMNELNATEQLPFVSGDVSHRLKLLTFMKRLFVTSRKLQHMNELNANEQLPFVEMFLTLLKLIILSETAVRNV